MPRIVDHAERRASIARCFVRLVAEHGFAATTYTRTAAAAGVSVGTIQHYFAARDDLVRAAFDSHLRERDARIAAVVEAGETAGRPIRTILRDALAELLPLDATRRDEHTVALRLRAEAAHDSGLAAIAADADHELHRRVRDAVRNGTVCGEVAPGTDVRVAASRVLAVSRGLALELAAGPGPDPAAVLDPVLAGVFAGRCRRHG